MVGGLEDIYGVGEIAQLVESLEWKSWAQQPVPVTSALGSTGKQRLETPQSLVAS